MNLSETCIRRPVLTTLMTASLIVFGAFAYRLLPVAALPAVDFPTIQISAQLPGASPETMAASVAAPIERQLSTIAGISSMNSSSALGLTQITIQFDLNRNIDGAALDVQTALSTAAKNLPVEMTTPPSFRKVNPGDFPVLYLSMRSDTMPLSAVDDYAETVLAPQISQLPGIAQVLVYGAQKFAVRVQVDPVAAASRNISLEDIRTVIAQANSSAPVGTLQGQQQAVTLLATSAMEHAADYRDVVVAYRNGAPIKLSEVARVIDSVENDKIATWFNDSRAIVLAIQRQPDANTVEVVDSVRAKLPQMRAQVPPAIEMAPLFDRSISIRAAVANVQETLVIAFVLVMLVIFLFLRKLSATIIPALAVPVSVVGTCAAMYAFGFSINNMTLLALTLSVGFVVDDAIVMLENIVRHVEGGMRPFEAALKGAREIGFTIVSITFSLIAVFIPVLLMGGLVGRVFREFAVTIAVAIVVSGFVSLTLTPMLCARVLKGETAEEHKREIWILRVFEALFERMKAAYEWSLDRVLARKSVMLMVTLATIAGTIWLYVIVPKGFFPTEDTGYVIGITEGNTDIAFPAMVDHQRKVADIVRQDPAVAYINSTVGAGGPNSLPNSGRMLVAMKPRDERGTQQEILARLRREANIFPGIQIFFQPIQNINLGGKLAKSQYQYTLQSNDTEALYRIAPELRDKIAKLPGLLDVTTDLYVKNPQVTVTVDREKAAVYGVSIDQVRQQLYDAFGSRQVATIYTPANNYEVILETKPEFQNSPNDLNKIYLKTNAVGGLSGATTIAPGAGVTGIGVLSGQVVPLSAVTKFVRTVGPLQVNHQGQQPAVTISFNVQPGTSLGQATDAVDNLLREERLPATITVAKQGTTQVFEESLRGQWILVIAAIFAAYVVLGILYESFIHPITIISGLPSAGIGAILTLMLFKMDLSVIAMIGIVMLVGIVKKNAIMMIDFAIERRRVGLSAEAAIREAATLRFRPIMMTTFAAIFGTIPIALGTGAGAELRQPLGVAVVGGLLLSQLLTLYITPVIYLYLDRFDKLIKRRIEPQLQEVEEREPAVAAE
ncbi:MAG TPA: efflux RND transporter permease subunit [Pseudolabrys sp.]|nr:efflux RND transporter permease subunit [Pseudolabrys sp.]